MLNQENTLLLVIDIQEKLLNAVFNKANLEKKSQIMKNASDILSIPIIVTEQYPRGLGETVNNLKVGASVYEKTSFNALEDVNLLEELKNIGKTQILVMGIETHICVYQTVSDLLKMGFNVTVIADACGSRSEYEYNQCLNVMKSEGANIKTTEMILFELLKSAKHPNFKDIQNLIK